MRCTSFSTTRGGRCSQLEPPLEPGDRLAHTPLDRHRLPGVRVDGDRDLGGGDQSLVRRSVVRLELPRHAGGAYPADAHEYLELVVEPGRCVVLDVLRPHHELRIRRLACEHAKITEVLDAGAVEIG